MGSRRQDHFLHLERRRDQREVCIPLRLVGATLEAGATFLIRRILGPCNWRLII